MSGLSEDNIALREVGEEAAQGDKVVGLGNGGEFVTLITSQAIQPQPVLSDDFTRDFVDFNVTAELDEAFKVEAVVLGGLSRTATLDLYMFDKVENKF